MPSNTTPATPAKKLKNQTTADARVGHAVLVHYLHEYAAETAKVISEIEKLAEYRAGRDRGQQDTLRMANRIVGAETRQEVRDVAADFAAAV